MLRLHEAAGNGNEAPRGLDVDFLVQRFVSCKPGAVSLTLLLGGNTGAVEILNYYRTSFFSDLGLVCRSMAGASSDVWGDPHHLLYEKVSLDHHIQPVLAWKCNVFYPNDGRGFLARSSGSVSAVS